MKRLILFLIFCLWGQGLQAQIGAHDPRTVVALLQSVGLKADMAQDSFGDPTIKVDRGNSSFLVYFYGCDTGDTCDALQFFAGYRTEGSWPVEAANIWNQEQRFVRAYVSEEGSARLEMDVLTGAQGVGPRYMAQLVNTWVTHQARFEKTVGWE